ncbi:MAG: bifunctional phosphoribosylaminoimidazolecarboxamide formyltransferase/IMP cyclohydrolase [Flavobacteriales bacterium]|nr:bifunctional phosphoribosylaminoimidazolecarboxamide formyltransferase/IMP cyclohydrolase [Flavobacteriales bacterium]
MNKGDRIRSALISVYHKEGLTPIVEKLHELGVTIYSTGGTQAFIEKAGIPVVPVEELTSYPSILGGRVKTLHPKVFGGILGRRELEGDVAQLEEFEIPPIDLVIVDLYPFEATVAAGADHASIIEQIDIGGIALIRAASKNYKDVVIVPSREHYPALQELLDKGQGRATLDQRRSLASAGFAVSSHYDSAIHTWLAGDNAQLRLSAGPPNVLRYGENPHQKAAFHGDLEALFTQLNGKELSYNNLLDLDAAMGLIDDMATLPGVPFAVIKHNNACGAAIRPTLLEAWTAALAGDPVSAFGGILVTSATIDAATAEAIDAIFFEIIVAPGFSEEALATLRRKKNRIILQRKTSERLPRNVRSVLNGVLVQDQDTKLVRGKEMQPATKLVPAIERFNDLTLANILVKHTKSNAIVLVKDGQLLASGTGQTSRVDALQQAIEKARKFDFDLKGAIMASDAFFPFPDCVELAAEAGIDLVVQPGGSVRDQESIDACNKLGIAMVITGHRHFKH